MTAIIAIIILTLLSKLAALGREIGLSYIWGVGDLIDSYIIVMIIPAMLIDIFGMAINTCFIPIYKLQRGKQQTRYFSEFFWGGVIIAIASSFLIYFFMPFILPYLSDNLTDKINHLTKQFILPASIFLFLNILNEIGKSLLIAHQKQQIIPLSTILGNLIFITVLFIFNKKVNDALLLGFAFVSFMLIQVVINQIYIKWIIRINITWPVKFKLSIHKRFFFLFVPIMFGSAANQINNVVGKLIATNLGENSLSVLYFSQQIYGIFIGVFVVTLATYFYPRLCDVKNDEQLINNIVYPGRLFAIILGNIIIMSAFFSVDIVSVIYKRGAFDSAAVGAVANVFFYYIFGLFFESISALYKRAYWAKENTKEPITISIIGILANIVLIFPFSKYYGVSGIALAASVSSGVTCFLLVLFYKKRYLHSVSWNSFFDKKDIIIMLFLLCNIPLQYMLSHFFDFNFLYKVLLSGCVLVVSSLIILYKMRIMEEIK